MKSLEINLLEIFPNLDLELNKKVKKFLHKNPENNSCSLIYSKISYQYSYANLSSKNPEEKIAILKIMGKNVDLEEIKSKLINYLKKE